MLANHWVWQHWGNTCLHVFWSIRWNQLEWACFRSCYGNFTVKNWQLQNYNMTLSHFTREKKHAFSVMDGALLNDRISNGILWRSAPTFTNWWNMIILPGLGLRRWLSSLFGCIFGLVWFGVCVNVLSCSSSQLYLNFFDINYYCILHCKLSRVVMEFRSFKTRIWH